MTFLAAARAAGLTPSVGLQAITRDHKACIVVRKGQNQPTGSIDTDAAYSAIEAQVNRWDYGLGFEHRVAECAVWVEPHSATSTHEVSTMIRKLQWLKDKLATPEYEQLRLMTEQTGQVGLRKYWWVTTGRISIRRGTPQEKQLANVGLNYPVRSFRLGKE